MTTARDIIKKSLQKIGALVKSEEPSADEASDGLAALNAMLESWGNDSLNIYARTLESFTLTGAGTYTIGLGGTLNTSRPSNIVSAYVRQGLTDYPLGIVTDEAFASIVQKNNTGLPEFLNYTNGFDLSTIRLFPVDTGGTLFLLSEKPFNLFANLDSQVTLPPGWDRALIYNLALELAPEYSQKPDPYIIKTANESLGLIKRKVAQVRTMDAFPQNLNVRNIFTGYWR